MEVVSFYVKYQLSMAQDLIDGVPFPYKGANINSIARVCRGRFTAYCIPLRGRE